MLYLMNMYNFVLSNFLKISEPYVDHYKLIMIKGYLNILNLFKDYVKHLQM